MLGIPFCVSLLSTFFFIHLIVALCVFVCAYTDTPIIMPHMYLCTNTARTHIHFFVLNYNNNNDIISKLLLFCQQVFTSIHTGGSNPLPTSHSINATFYHLIPGILFYCAERERCWCNQQFTMFIWIRMWHPFCTTHCTCYAAAWFSVQCVQR